MKTINNYAKKIAENNTGKIYENTHTTGYYLKEILEHGGGGGGGYDDTAIKRRITAVENGKQDKLTAGQNITISGNTITAREIIDDTIHSATTVWSSNKVKGLLEAFEGGVDISIVETKPDPSVAVEKTMYYVGTASPYHVWFFVNGEYTDFGTTELDLSNYFTKDEINELLELKVDKVVGKSLVSDIDIGQITTNKIDIANLDSEKVDKEVGKSLVWDIDIAQITTNKNDIADLKTDKQDKLTAGQNITITGNTIAAKNIIDDTKDSATTVWSSTKVKGLLEALEGQVDIVITPTRPMKSSAVEKTMYYVGTESPYHIWFFVNDEYTDFGTTELDLSDYYTKVEVDDLLDDKVDKETGKSLINYSDLVQIEENAQDISDIRDGRTINTFGAVETALDGKVDKEAGKSLVSNTDITQITTNKNDITSIKDGVDIDSFGDVETALDDKQDKITDSTLSTLTDSTTVSSVSATSKTNKTFSLSKLWEYITSKVSTAISSSSTDTDIPSAKSVYDYVKVEPFRIAGRGGASGERIINGQNMYMITIGSQKFLTGSFQFSFPNTPLTRGANRYLFNISNVTFPWSFRPSSYLEDGDFPISVKVTRSGDISVGAASAWDGTANAMIVITFGMVPVSS